MVIQFFAEVLEKPFQETKFIFKSLKLIGYKLLFFRLILKTQRQKQHIFDRTSCSGFMIREFKTKKNFENWRTFAKNF